MVIGSDTFHDQHRAHISHQVPADLSGFWVITVLSNPVRYRRRYELYHRFAQMCKDAEVNLITVEQAFGNRRFMVTESSNPNHLQIRTVEELWHKENMINMGVKHAQMLARTRGQEVKEVAWVDADCRAARMPRDWFEETWHELQHFEFVQMWESLIDLDYNFQAIGTAQPGFMANYIKYGTPNPVEFKEIQERKHERHHRRHHHKHHHRHHHHKPEPPPYPYGTIFGRPGLAWAANIEAFNRVGGLIDCSILGAGDWYMAHGLVGAMRQIVGPHLGSDAYCQKLLQWQTLSERWIKRDVGFVRGVVYHDFHGKKINRGYKTRGQILFDNGYDPGKDIKYDSFGMIQLETWEPRQIKMRDQIRQYFRDRNEDEIS